MDLILHLIQKLVNFLTKILAKHAAWQCYFCKQFFSTEHPRINAYHDGAPIFQCEECRVRLDIEKTPTEDPRLNDSWP